MNISSCLLIASLFSYSASFSDFLYIASCLFFSSISKFALSRFSLTLDLAAIAYMASCFLRSLSEVRSEIYFSRLERSANAYFESFFAVVISEKILFLSAASAINMRGSRDASDRMFSISVDNVSTCSLVADSLVIYLDLISVSLASDFFTFA